jgi:hypothetical protein
MSAMVVGVAAALTFTSSVKAQEIENTVWADGSNTAPVDQPTTTTVAQNSNPAPVMAEKTKDVAAKVSDAAPQSASLLQQTPVYALLVVMAPMGIAFVAVSALLKAKRLTGTRIRKPRMAASAGL